MSKIRLVLRKDKKTKKDTAPINLKITQRGAKKYISTGISVKLSEWDFTKNKVNNNHPNSVRMNNTLNGILYQYESKIIDTEAKETYITLSDIKQKLKSKETQEFFPYADNYTDEFERKGKIATYKRGKSVIKKFKEFLKNDKILIEELNKDIFEKFEFYLSDTKKNDNPTIHSNFKYIKTIINKYIKEGKMTMDKNPFLNFNIKLTPTQKDFLTEDELLKIENLKLEKDSPLYTHRNIYVFSAYAGGLRISDVLQLKWENFKDERITIKIQKTKQPLAIKIPNKAIQIINLYKNKEVKPSDYIFPLLKCKDANDPTTLFNSISSAAAYTNSNLKDIAGLAGVKKKFSFHSARHTFATRALKKGMRKEYVSKIMGHTTDKETNVYIKIVNEDLDNAIEILN